MQEALPGQPGKSPFLRPFGAFSSDAEKMIGG
jgi:hypothetical protein